MNSSALHWCATCAIHDPHAPPQIAKLGKQVLQYLFERNERVNINRAFHRSGVTYAVVKAWLDTPQYHSAGLKSTNVAIALNNCLDAFDQIDKGTLASIAWNLGAQRGPKKDFSKTLEATALSGALAKMNYPVGSSSTRFKPAQARQYASEIMGVREDEIRKFEGCEAANDKSEACLALSGILNRNLQRKVGAFFDLEDLVLAAKV
jgi:hypothetical protein